MHNLNVGCIEQVNYHSKKECVASLLGALQSLVCSFMLPSTRGIFKTQLPQLHDQSDPTMPSEVLSASVAGFLSDALSIDKEYIEGQGKGVPGLKYQTRSQLVGSATRPLNKILF
jgi:hypothetical protein